MPVARSSVFSGFGVSGVLGVWGVLGVLGFLVVSGVFGVSAWASLMQTGLGFVLRPRISRSEYSQQGLGVSGLGA